MRRENSNLVQIGEKRTCTLHEDRRKFMTTSFSSINLELLLIVISNISNR
jgi:hypothetical protein